MSEDNVKSIFGGDVVHPDDKGKLPDEVKDQIEEDLLELIQRIRNDELIEVALVGRLSKEYAPYPLVKLFGEIGNPLLMKGYIQTLQEIYTECYINPILYGFDKFEE